MPSTGGDCARAPLNSSINARCGGTVRSEGELIRKDMTTRYNKFDSIELHTLL